MSLCLWVKWQNRKQSKMGGHLCLLLSTLPEVWIPLWAVLKAVVVVDSELCPGPQRHQSDHTPDVTMHRVMEVTEPAVRPETVIHLVIKARRIERRDKWYNAMSSPCEPVWLCTGWYPADDGECPEPLDRCHPPHPLSSWRSCKRTHPSHPWQVLWTWPRRVRGRE